MLGHFLKAAAGGQSGSSNIIYVGGRAEGFLGTTSNRNISLTGLSGGIASSPSTGDLVIVGFATASTSDRSLVISGYTEVADLYANDTYDTNLDVAYKFNAGETSLTLTGGTFSSLDAGTVTIQVFRNVSQSTPLDVTTTTATASNGGIPTPPAITPVTAGAVIVCIAANAHAKNSGSFTASQLSNFQQSFSNDTYDSGQGSGTFNWVSGAFTPSQWTWTGGADSSASWAAVTMALRPA